MKQYDSLILSAIAACAALGCSATSEEPPHEPPARYQPGESARQLGVNGYVLSAESGDVHISAVDDLGAEVARVTARWTEGVHQLDFSAGSATFELQRSALGELLRLDGVRSDGTAFESATVDGAAGQAAGSSELGAEDVELLRVTLADFVFVPPEGTIGVAGGDWDRSTIGGGRGYGEVNSSRTRIRACDEASDGLGVRSNYTAGPDPENPTSDLVGDADGEGGDCGEEGPTGGPPIRSFQACAGKSGANTHCGPTLLL